MRVDGKFLRLGAEKFYLKGVTYGPFAPDADGCTFASQDQTARDFELVRELGANTVRVYYVPPRWLLDLAQAHELKVLVDVPWEKHRCFLETYEMREAARVTVRSAAQACAGHPAVLALSIANEVPAEIVRWHGVTKVAAFLDELIAEVKRIDAAMLCTFASFPPTEFLQPTAIDFVTFNVYLHDRQSLDLYLARLQTLANDKPLVLGEFGMDSIREGEEQKAVALRAQVRTAFINGLAGTVVFSFTDDWFRGGQQITDWQFGLTTRDRQKKHSFLAVQTAYRDAPYFPLKRTPRVSVVVASYNGAKTLQTCLESLTRLKYPDYEVILVDDGSTDCTQEIAAEFPTVRNIRQANLGLSAARNAGIRAATGEIVAFTDSDCRADEDWLFYLVSAFLRSDFVAIGGHNFLPPEDSATAAAVLVSPGGPAHVMVSDREAEHVPGCNMAFYKWALEQIHGFDPVFRKAGDDVDVCWRLMELGYRIGFSPAAFVWHYRRSTVKAYLKQQAGYGEAEALLAQKHPEYFNALGGGVWRGRIYTAGLPGLLLQSPVVYHGVFGTGFFQKMYARQPSFAAMVCTSLQFHVFVTLPLLLVGLRWTALLPVAVGALLSSLTVCVIAAAQAPLAKDRQRAWSRPLIAALFFLQPLVRGWAFYKQRIGMARPDTRRQFAVEGGRPVRSLNFWSTRGFDRLRFIRHVEQRLSTVGWYFRPDSGWDDFDFEIRTQRWATAQLITAEEELSRGRRFLRCRVTARFSWFTWAAVSAALVVSVGTIELWREQQPLVWFMPVLIPLLWLLILDQEQRQAAAIAGFVRRCATEMELEEFSSSTANDPMPETAAGLAPSR